MSIITSGRCATTGRDVWTLVPVTPKEIADRESYLTELNWCEECFNYSDDIGSPLHYCDGCRANYNTFHSYEEYGDSEARACACPTCGSNGPEIADRSCVHCEVALVDEVEVFVCGTCHEIIPTLDERPLRITHECCPELVTAAWERGS